MEETGIHGELLQMPKGARKKKEPFTSDEDARLQELVAMHGPENWQAIAAQLPGRSPRQCRERWKLYLSPEVKNDPWSLEEEQRLVKMYLAIGPKWTLIAKAFPSRTANNVKNKAKQALRRVQKVYKSGIQPIGGDVASGDLLGISMPQQPPT